MNCPACELPIPTVCRRCKRPFPTAAELQLEIQRLQELVAALTAQLDARSPAPQLFAAPLPTMEEWKRLLIAEAIRQAGKHRAAALIGIGTTTIYRIFPGKDTA
jgi:hypothetical protein